MPQAGRTVQPSRPTGPDLLSRPVDEIEILAFRADQRASLGITADHIAAAASAYDPESQPAPIVIGHPRNDSPAHGIISGARAEGSNLYLKLKNLGQAVLEGVRNSELVSRSIAFWDPHHPSNPTPGQYSIRHLGFLGAQAPGIPNMGALKFSAEGDLVAEGDPAEAVVFAPAATPVQVITEPPADRGQSSGKDFAVTDEEAQALKDRLAKLEGENTQLRTEAASAAQFAAQARTAAITGRVDKLVEAGRLAADSKGSVVAMLAALPATLEFSANDKADSATRVLDFIDSLNFSATPADTSKTPKTPQEQAEFGAKDAAKAASDALAAENARLGQAWKPKA